MFLLWMHLRVVVCFCASISSLRTRAQLEVTDIPTHVVGTRHFIPGFMRDGSGEQPAIVRGGAESEHAGVERDLDVGLGGDVMSVRSSRHAK